jgi:hypothetical protein
MQAMSDTSPVQLFKLLIIEATGLSKDSLHVYVGMTAFLGVSLLVRKPRASLLPLATVAVAAGLGEFVDLVDDYTSLGHVRIGASVHDIWNTMFWPTVLYLLLRFTRLFGGELAKR